MLFRALLIFVVGVFSPSLLAQPTGVIPPVDLCFYVYGRGDFEDLFYAAQPRQLEPLDLSRGRRSDIHRYRGESSLSLLREDGVDEKGAPLYRTVAQVELPGTSDAFILMIPNPDWRSGVRDLPEFLLFAIDDRPEMSPVDHLVFLNLTGAALTGVVGNEEVVLGPGLSRQIPLDEYFGQSDVLVGLAVRYQDSHRVVLENRQRFAPGYRLMYVLLPPKREGSLAIGAFKVSEKVDLPVTEDSHSN